jgi:RNA polymerase sigma factor (sigma-70 family)
MFLTSEARYNQWVRDHYRFLMRSAWALTRSRSVAEDVVQDCFASAWKYRNQLKDASLVRPWLFKIMRRSLLRHISPATQSFEDRDEAEWGEAPHTDISNRLDVVKALDRVALIHREVLVLHYFDDMSTAQIAEALEIAPGTVLSRLSRAREALKKVLTSPMRPQTNVELPVANVTSIKRR